MYAYAGNNPVKYTDPDGKSPIFFSPKDLFSFLCKNDDGVKTAKLYADAANGDQTAQAVAKEVTVAAEKEMASGTLEAVAIVSNLSSEAMSDLALEAVVIQPEASITAGTTSLVFSGIEIATRIGKAALTGNQEDIDKARETKEKNIGSALVGAAPSIIFGKAPKEITNLVGNILSKFFVYVMTKITIITHITG